MLIAVQVDSFLPCHLADMMSAYAHMVHHPGPLIDQMTQRILPKLHTMDAGWICFHAASCASKTSLLFTQIGLYGRLYAWARFASGDLLRSAHLNVTRAICLISGMVVLARVSTVFVYVGALCSVLWAHGVLQTLTPDLFDKVCEVLETKPLAEFKPHVSYFCAFCVESIGML